jgi:REP-associated tyrosine transposase
MPRANRHFLPDQVWHLTHRCHEKAFLLKFARDRRLYLRWLFEAKKRFGLCVLNYTVTSNHVHLLVKDTGKAVIPRSLQLIAGRTAQAYNARKGRSGAFCEDRYHATAIEADTHLHRCLTYIDLNIVRAGVVKHPGQWAQSGYREVHHPPTRYGIIDRSALSALCGFKDFRDFQDAHRAWVSEALSAEHAARDPRWSEAIAVGNLAFVERVKQALGVKALHRTVTDSHGTYTLREPEVAYTRDLSSETGALRPDNTLPWEENLDVPDT